MADIPRLAEAAASGGADAIIPFNTVPGMSIDINTGKPRVGNPHGVGSISGKAVKPMGVRAVLDAVRVVDIPIIGVGGIEDGLDVSVQTGEMHDSSLAVRQLTTTRYVICAAPAYFASHAAPQSPEELHSHTCINYRRPRTGRVREWKVMNGTTVRQITVNSAMTFNRIGLLIEAARAGYGLIQVPECYAQPYLARGELIETLEDCKAGGYTISVVYRQQQRLAPKVRVFMDFLTTLFDPPPWALPEPGQSSAPPPKQQRKRQRS